MAEDLDKPQAIPPVPKGAAIVSDQALYMAQISLYRNSLAFGGQRDPSTIWATMVYNHPQAMMLYRELEDKDEDVANALETLRLSVLDRSRSVQPGDESQLGLDVANFIEQQLGQVQDFHGVLDCILDAPGYGFSVQEMIFDASEGQASLIGINDCPQELFLFGDRYQPQIGQMQFLDQPWASTGRPVPEEKFIVFSYRMRGRNRMGRPLLKSVFWPSWFKRNMLRLWVQFAEKGPGTAVVQYADPDDEAQKRNAAAVAQAIVENTAVAIPQNMTLMEELLKSARSQDPAVYENFYQKMQYAITRKVLGETLTSFGNEGGRGSQAQGQTHADTLETRSIELCRAVESVINRQLIRPLVLWNFGPSAPMPKWSFDLEQQEDLVARLTVDSGLQRMGKKFTAGYIADRYETPLAPGEDPDAELVPNTSAPQPMVQDKVSFSEAQANADLAEFDKVFAQLDDEARDLYRERIREVADAARPQVVR
jgi:phage gp29-like protein